MLPADYILLDVFFAWGDFRLLRRHRYHLPIYSQPFGTSAGAAARTGSAQNYFAASRFRQQSRVLLLPAYASRLRQALPLLKGPRCRPAEQSYQQQSYRDLFAGDA
jgi:hypothetical protein